LAWRRWLEKHRARRQAAPLVRTLKSSAEALITLINDVLDLSKAEAASSRSPPARSNCAARLEQVIG